MVFRNANGVFNCLWFRDTFEIYEQSLWCTHPSQKALVSLPPAYIVRQEGNSFTLFVSPHLGGGSGQVSCWGGSGQSVSWWGGCQVSQLTGGVRSVSWRGAQVSQLMGEGCQVSQPGGVRSSWWGGSGPAGRGGQVHLGGGQSVGGVSILRPLAGSMPLAFTQEDFLVLT